MVEPVRARPPREDHSWADYLLYMEAGAEVLSLPSPSARRPERPVWGLLLCAAIGGLAGWLATAPWPVPLDAVMLAIPIGMLVGNLWTPPVALRPGIRVAIKGVLPLGICLLGARLDLRELVAVGVPAFGLSLVVIALSLGLLLGIGRLLGMNGRLSTLLGVGTGICGGSAIVATAPVIDADESDVAFSVSTVALLGLVAMFAFPWLGAALDLDPAVFGMWAGLAIHQTPQVVAAGFAYGLEAGETATVVKLVRVCLLAPAVFAIGLVYARLRSRHAHVGGLPPFRYRDLVPGFVLGLLALVAARTLGLLPELTLRLGPDSLLGARELSLDSVALATAASHVCIVVAMGAVGIETNLAALRRTGPRPLLAAALGGAVTTACALLGALTFAARG